MRLKSALAASIIAASFLVGNIIFKLPSAQGKIVSKGKNTVTPSQENFETAMTKYKEKDLDGAIDAFLQAIYFSRNYFNPDAYYWLGVCYMDKKQDAKAIEALKKHCEQAIGATPEGHLRLGQLYLRNNRLKEAEQEAITAADHYNGPGPKAKNLMGMIKEKQGFLPEAAFQYEEALGDPPWRYTEAWMNYAELEMKEKNWFGALRQFHNMLNSKIVLKDLDYEKVFLNMGLCLMAKGDHQGAIDHWHECLNYNPRNASAHLHLAMLFDTEQHFSSAINEYREFVRFSEDQAAVTRVKDRISKLEQQVNPTEIEPQAPKPSPYMRKQQGYRETDEPVDGEPMKQTSSQTPSTPLPSAKDSGF